MFRNQQISSLLLETMKLLMTIVEHMLECIKKKKYTQVELMLKKILECGDNLQSIIFEVNKQNSLATTSLRWANFIHSTMNITKLLHVRSDNILYKIEFELLMIIQSMHDDFYYFACIHGDKEKEKEYYSETFFEVGSSQYINRSMELNYYKYDLSIYVCGYNKLEYTKACVESILETVPKSLNYELILLNNGSTDGTQAYFDSLGCNKVITFINNIRSDRGIQKIFEGKYVLGVSNDIVVSKNSIENLLICIESDEKIAMVVPATSNVSNYQSLDITYSTKEEFDEFIKKNNISSPNLWEERSRLCNPIALFRSDVHFSNRGIGAVDKAFIYTEFGDDALSLRLRRAGYKMILAKDSYCHHYGSVTLRESQVKENTLDKSRKIFIERYGIDAWGIGFCYDQKLIDSLSLRNDINEINILGINSGFGSNPLKIKSIYKELGVNNVKLYYAVDKAIYIQDLNIYSEDIKEIDYDNFKIDSNILFDYILIEDNISLIMGNIDILKKALKSDGVIIVCVRNDKESKLIKEFKPIEVINGDVGKWFFFFK